MTLSRVLVHRISNPARTGANPLTNHSPTANQLQWRKPTPTQTHITQRLSVVCAVTGRLQIAACATASRAPAVCESGEVNSGTQQSRETDFRRPSLSAASSSAAPRCPTLRRVPSVPSPNLELRSSSSSISSCWTRSHTSALLRPRHHVPSSALRAFSTSTSSAMAATKIDGTAIARGVRERLQAEIAEKKGINPRFQPSLKIIQGALRSPPRRQTLLEAISNQSS